MKFRSLSAIAASTVLSFTPLAIAHAQSEWSIGQRESWLDSRIDRARDDGAIDGRQARQLHDAVRNIRTDEDRMRDDSYGDLSGYDRDNLSSRIDGVANRLDNLSDHEFAAPW